MGIEIQPSRFFQGDTAVLKILVGEDLSNYVATDLTIRVTRPDDTRFAMTTTRTIVSPTVGEISVVFSSSDLNQNGEYVVQAAVSTSGQPSQSFNPGMFRVENLMSAP